MWNVNFRRLFLGDHFRCSVSPRCRLENTEFGSLGGEEVGAQRHEGYRQFPGNCRIPRMPKEVLTCRNPSLRGAYQRGWCLSAQIFTPATDSGAWCQDLQPVTNASSHPAPPTRGRKVHLGTDDVSVASASVASLPHLLGGGPAPRLVTFALRVCGSSTPVSKQFVIENPRAGAWKLSHVSWPHQGPQRLLGGNGRIQKRRL